MNLIFELGRAQRVLEDLERLIVVHKKEISSYKSKEGKQQDLSLIHISEPTRLTALSRMPSAA